MAYVYESVGWSDWNGRNWKIPTDLSNPQEGERGLPARASTAQRILVHAFDPKNPEDQRHFWAPTPVRIRTWDEWDDLIDEYMDMYGLELAS
jgi:hypothetical protein